MSHCGRRRGSLRWLVHSEEGFSECWPLPWVRRTGVQFLQLLPPKDTRGSAQPTAWARPSDGPYPLPPRTLPAAP